LDAVASPDLATRPADNSSDPDAAPAQDAAADTTPAIDTSPLPSSDAAAPSAPRPGSPRIAGCPAFPADNEWNRPVADDPVDPSSTTYIAAMNGGTSF
jgi:hypothetical protein